MSSVIIFNDIEVKDSVISGGETTTTKDNTSPFSFLEFITNTGVDYSPEQYNKFYLYYLEKWANYKNSSATNDTIKFTDLFPVSISGLQLNTAESDLTPPTFEISFRYHNYTIEVSLDIQYHLVLYLH